ncbi:MAG: hypothetical protein ACOC0N_01485 [Chroococcales cyanobacterium]
MKRFFLCSLLTVVPLLISSPVKAEPQGFQGNYLGSPLDGNVPEGLLEFLESGPITPSTLADSLVTDSDEKNVNGQFQGRYDVPNLPVSLRGVAYSNGETKAILPMISYDHPVMNNANIYAGAGYAFVKSAGVDTPVGERDGLVLTTGIEAKVIDGIVLFGDAKYRVNSDRNDGNNPLRLQMGIGYGF